MPQIKRKLSSDYKSQDKRQFVYSKSEKLLLKKIGLKIHHDLTQKDRPVEWLAFKVGMSRSTIREILAGRSNFRFLTLNSIAKGLDYNSLTDFLRNL